MSYVKKNFKLFSKLVENGERNDDNYSYSVSGNINEIINNINNFISGKSNTPQTQLENIERITEKMLKIVLENKLLLSDEKIISIPVMRGGGLMVDMVNRFFDNNILLPVSINRIGDTPLDQRYRQSLNLTWISDQSNLVLFQKKCLILDVIVGTGNTIKKVINEILPHKPSHIVILTLYNTPDGMVVLNKELSIWKQDFPEIKFDFLVACQSGKSDCGGWAYPDPGDAGDIFGKHTNPKFISKLLLNKFGVKNILQMLTKETNNDSLYKQNLYQFQNIFTNRNAECLRNYFLNNIEYTKEMRFNGVESFYIHLTKFCPVKCEGCMYASPPQNTESIRLPGKVMSDEELTNVIEFLSPIDMDEVAISGGGESFLELEKILRFIRDADVKRIILITSGYWGIKVATARDIIERINHALTERKKSVELEIRLSIDEFHQKNIPFSTLENIVDIVREPQFNNIGLFIRSIQTLYSKKIIADFARFLCGKVEGDGYSQRIVLNDLIINILYKPLIFHGRMENDYPGEYERININTFNGSPGLEIMKSGKYGLKGNIEVDGLITTVGSTAPDNFGSIYTDNFESFQKKLFKDIISRTLMDEGYTYFVDILKEIIPDVYDRTIECNDMYLYFHQELQSIQKRLYVTLRLIKEYEKKGKIVTKNFPKAIQKILTLSNDKLKYLYCLSLLED